MPTAGSDAHVVLETGAGGTTTGLILAQREGQYIYQATRLPPIPSEDLVAEQSSWHRGFGDYLFNPNEPYFYGWSDGVDLRYPNSAQLIPNISPPLSFLVRNGGAESGVTTEWTFPPSVTGAINTSSPSPQQGINSFKITDSRGSPGAGYDLMTQNLTNPTVYQSRTVTWAGYLRCESGSSGVRLVVTDGVATQTSSTVTSTSAWVYATVDITVDAGATVLTVGVERTNGTGTIFHADQLFVIIGTLAGIVPMAHYGDALYMAYGVTVCVWDETNDVFDAVFIDSGDEINSLAVHGDYIFAGTDDDYHYSNDQSGARITWTTISPTTGVRTFMVSALDELGVRRLFAGGHGSSLYVSNEASFGAAIGAGDWDAALTVGETDKFFNRLYAAFDTVLAGRFEGLFYFYPPDNIFRSATDQFVTMPHTDNFESGTEYIDGWFYTTVTRTGLIRIRFEAGDIRIEPVAPRYTAPMYDDFGGRVTGIGQDGVWLYALQSTAVADATVTKQYNILAARSDGRDLIWHTLRKVDMSDGRAISTFDDFVYFQGRLFITGTTYEAKIYRMALPTLHLNMMKMPSSGSAPDIRDLEDSGTKVLVTPVFDFADRGYGSDDKNWSKVDVIGENLDANLTITVEIQTDANIDDAGSWTAVGSAITTNEKTEAITQPQNAKRARLRFTEATNVTTNGPILRRYRIHATPAPERYWYWNLTARIATGLAGTGETAQNILANLDTLDGETRPLKFYDIDGTSYDARIISMEKVVSPTMSQDSGMERDEHIEQLVRLTIREVKMS